MNITTSLNWFKTKLQQFNTPLVQDNSPLMFSFGDPEPVLDSTSTSWLMAYPSATAGYYVPPVDYASLASIMDANAYHGPILYKKKDLLMHWMKDSKLISREDLERLCLDFVVTGNAYLEKKYNSFGNVVRLVHQPAIYMYRGLEQKAGDSAYYMKVEPITGGLNYTNNTTIFAAGDIVHLMEPDIKQAMYGKPQYYGGIQSVLLSEASTLFRRKYYVNGAHLGYILVANDANFSTDTAKQIEDKIKDSKGAGNFKSMFINIPRSGSREPLKVIPIGDIGSKDEYQAISEVSEMAMCAMHRMPPQIANIIPANVGGFGDLDKTMRMYYDFEVVPLQQKLLQLNGMIGKPVISFSSPNWTLA